MSDEKPEEPDEAFDGLTRSAVSSQAREIVGECAKQLGELLGCEVASKGADVHAVQKDAVADGDSPLLHQLCKTAGDSSLPLHILASRESSGTLAGLQLGKESEQLEELRKQELDSEGREAFQNLMQAVTNPIAQGLEQAGLPEIEVRDAREVPEPASDPTWLDGDDFIRLRLEFSIDGHPDVRLDVLLPRSASDEAESSADLRLIFVESCSEEFDRLEEIASNVAFELSVVQPATLLEELEDAADADTIVVPWEISGRSGLELLEDLVGREELANARFAMSSQFPRRDQIHAARRAGAVSFLKRPYEREEIERRFASGASSAGSANEQSKAQGSGKKTAKPATPDEASEQTAEDSAES